jgi:hypothetical protein
MFRYIWKMLYSDTTYRQRRWLWGFRSTARQCAINPIDPLKIGVEINFEISKYEIELAASKLKINYWTTTQKRNNSRHIQLEPVNKKTLLGDTDNIRQPSTPQTSSSSSKKEIDSTHAIDQPVWRQPRSRESKRLKVAQQWDVDNLRKLLGCGSS